MSLQHDPAEKTVPGLIRTLVDDSRDYVRAEIDVVRETARARIASARVAIVVGIAAIFFVQAGLTVLFIAIGSALVPFVGLWAGQLIAAAIAFAIAGIMVKYAISHISPHASVTGEPS